MLGSRKEQQHTQVPARVEGLSGSRWLAFSMTEQPARDADLSQVQRFNTDSTPGSVRQLVPAAAVLQLLATQSNSTAIFPVLDHE
jgi:hypothetical protein